MMEDLEVIIPNEARAKVTCRPIDTKKRGKLELTFPPRLNATGFFSSSHDLLAQDPSIEIDISTSESIDRKIADLRSSSVRSITKRQKLWTFEV
jgi:hypothetical protein